MKPGIEDTLRTMFSEQLIAVLATSYNDEPYSCLVSYAFTDDLRHLVFATMRKRLKYRHMSRNPNVSLMIDDRENEPTDLHQATSVTVIGKAEDTNGDEKESLTKTLLSKHPGLKDFVSQPDCAIIKVSIDKFVIVTEFESVIVHEC